MKFNEDSRVDIPTDNIHQSIKRINPALTNLETKQCFDEVLFCDGHDIPSLKVKFKIEGK